MKGRAQAMLREMARQEACHAKQFGAVYFLKTGKKACPGRPDAPLRHLHQRNAPPALFRGARRARGV
ncbi:MAG: hypothetical protein ACLU3I_06030 [Acutalibacteraceae bacterium]